MPIPVGRGSVLRGEKVFLACKIYRVTDSTIEKMSENSILVTDF